MTSAVATKEKQEVWKQLPSSRVPIDPPFPFLTKLLVVFLALVFTILSLTHLCFLRTGYFTLLQFNTLANSLSDAFPYVDSKYLTWEHRKQLLVREILQHRPDVITLEEVDKEHYKDYFRPFLTEAGTVVCIFLG